MTVSLKTIWKSLKNELNYSYHVVNVKTKNPFDLKELYGKALCAEILTEIYF